MNFKMSMIQHQFKKKGNGSTVIKIRKIFLLKVLFLSIIRSIMVLWSGNFNEKY